MTALNSDKTTLLYIITFKSCSGIVCYNCPVSDHMYIPTACTLNSTVSLANLMNRNKVAYELAIKKYVELYGEEELFGELL